MNNIDQLSLSVFLVLFLGFVYLLVRHYWLGDKMFKLLAEKSPEYYLEIGEPMYFSDLVSNWRAQNYMMDLTVRGMPKDFPKDKETRVLAQKARRVGVIALLYLAAAFVVHYGAIVLL